MTQTMLAALVRGIAKPITEQIEKSIAPLRSRIEVLESQLAAEQGNTRGFDYKGVWTSGTTYRRNQGVTFAGSLWICLVDVISEPTRPNESRDWQLAVKRGGGDSAYRGRQP